MSRFAAVLPTEDPHNKRKPFFVIDTKNAGTRIATWLLTMFPEGHATSTVNLGTQRLTLVHTETDKGDPNVFVNTCLTTGPGEVRGIVYVFTVDPFDTEAKLTHRDTNRSQGFNLRRALDKLYREYRAREAVGARKRRQLIKTIKKGVKRARRPYDFFCSSFHSSFRQELREQGIDPTYKRVVRETHSRWTVMDPTQKERFRDLATKDQTRYRDDLASFKARYPEPPAKPKAAHVLYAAAAQTRADRVTWRNADPATKKQFIEMAESAMAEYKTRCAEFREWCRNQELGVATVCGAWGVKDLVTKNIEIIN